MYGVIFALYSVTATMQSMEVSHHCKSLEFAVRTTLQRSTFSIKSLCIWKQHKLVKINALYILDGKKYYYYYYFLISKPKKNHMYFFFPPNYTKLSRYVLWRSQVKLFLLTEFSEQMSTNNSCSKDLHLPPNIFIFSG